MHIFSKWHPVIFNRTINFPGEISFSLHNDISRFLADTLKTLHLMLLAYMKTDSFCKGQDGKVL